MFYNDDDDDDDGSTVWRRGMRRGKRLGHPQRPHRCTKRNRAPTIRQCIPFISVVARCGI